ncbi:MAG: efflux RND transporter periplasmic adaptor subunit [Balneolales bacterium]|nr:efflux RND transporter periplasmic adaptor subunit [Balneolales bacterium]
MKNSFRIWTPYLAVLLAGLLLGWLIFGGSHQHDHGDHHHSHNHGDSNGGETIYTCSMHPQIRQSEPGTCPLCAMDLTPVGDNGSDGEYFLTMTAAAVELAQIQTYEARYGREEARIRVPGTVAADETKLTYVTARYGGRITQLFANYTGQKVQKGEIIAEIYAPELLPAQREYLEALSQRDQRPEMLRSAERRLRLLEIPDDVIAGIAETGRIRDTFPIIANRSGTITRRMVSKDDYVQEGTILFALTDLSRVWLEFEAWEKDSQYIREGGIVNVKSRQNRSFEQETRITFVNPLIDNNRRTLGFRAELANPGGILRPGMLLEGEVVHRSASDELLIPETALLWTGTRSLVYVKLQDSEIAAFEPREVETGLRRGDYISILSGLEAGEKVVMNGAFKIDSEAQIAGKFSMMNRAEPLEIFLQGQRPDPHQTAEASRYEDVPEAFKNSLTNVVRSYLTAKDALVESSAAEALEAFSQMKERMEQIGEHGLSGSGHESWMTRYRNIMAHLNTLLQETDLDEIRSEFRFISDELVLATRQFGLTKVVYRQFCPMTFGDEGSYWLSSEPEIMNPYLPETMLMCGELIETIED